MKKAEVCLNGTDWVEVNQNSCDYIYSDALPMLLLIVDELAELTQPGGIKTPEGKEEDELKGEIISIMTSIAQLGRSAGIQEIIATQKPLAQLISTQLRSNPLNISTKICIE